MGRAKRGLLVSGCAAARGGSSVGTYPLAMAQLIASEPLIGTGKTEVRSLEVWAADDGSQVALIREVPGERSLRNANSSGRLVREIRSRYPGVRVIEYWPGDEDRFGPYREADEEGSSQKLDAVELQALGIPVD